MRRILGISCVYLLLFFVPDSAKSDLKGSFALSTAGGLALPIHNFEYNTGMGLGWEVEGEYFAFSRFSMGANLAYNTFRRGTDKYVRITSYGIFGKYYSINKGTFLLYYKFGLSTNNVTRVFESASKIGISVGTGGMYRVAEIITLGIEGMFHTVFEKERGDPFKKGWAEEFFATQYITIYGKLTLFLGKK